MTLSEGTLLGPYRILAPLGAGGMGEVYRASDTRLDRTVAIKVLPEHLSKSEEWRARFEREAKVISRLNHPNICTLHDVGREGDIHYLVMEHIEGETLAARLTRDALGLERVLEYGIQIAQGLDKAHRAGIVHRDLKPGNVMLTKTGVKLLDFGLAKEVAASPSSLSGTSDPDAPTEQRALTTERTIVGTLHYMAPEQVTGGPVDHRADVWALGAVLYEMATGNRAFEGSTGAGVMASILEKEPPPGNMPEGLGAVIRSCLTKDADERFQSVHDVKLQLQWLSTRRSLPAETRPKRSGLWALAAVAALFLALVTFSVFVYYSRPRPPAIPARVSINLPVATPVFPVVASTVAVSPDGRMIVFPSVVSGGGLHRRPLDSVEPVPIPGTDGGIAPFFSPNGAWIGFWANGSLKKIATDGGSAVTLCAASSLDGAAWLEDGDGDGDGSIVFASADSPLLQRVSASGGSPEPWSELGDGESRHRWPSALPDGRGVLFTVAERGEDWFSARIDVQSLDRSRRWSVVEGGTFPKYLPDGYLTFVRDERLTAVRFDLGRLETAGTAVPLIGNLAASAIDGRAQYDVSSNGVLVYLEIGHDTGRQLVWVSREGAVKPLTLAPRGYEAPRLSPDGRRVALTIRDEVVENADVWVLELEGGTLTRLTFDGNEQETPIWVDDEELTFAASRGGQFERETILKAADGSGGETKLSSTRSHHHLGSWSPDGRMLVTDEFSENWDIYLYSRGEASGRAIVASSHLEWGPRLTSDGKWLAYASDETGQSEIYVQDFPGLTSRWQVSNGGGREPVWAQSGRELFYRNGDAMIAVSIETAPSFRIGPPVVLFSGGFASLPWGSANYDVSADGQRFLLVRGEGSDNRSATRVSVILDWFEQVRQQVPAE